MEKKFRKKKLICLFSGQKRLIFVFFFDFFPMVSTNYPNALYNCQCKPGFTGKRCGDQINHCLSLPCNNNGYCNLLNSPELGPELGFECSCFPGFTGKLCQNFHDLCNSDPCHSSATCYTENNQFICACPPGKTGNTCSLDFNECESNPCRNGKCLDYRVVLQKCHKYFEIG